MWKQGQVYLAFVQTPLPYNGIIVEFFFSLRFVSSTLYSAIEVSNKLLFRIAYSTIRELANSIDKSESRVLLVGQSNPSFEGNAKLRSLKSDEDFSCMIKLTQ